MSQQKDLTPKNIEFATIKIAKPNLNAMQRWMLLPVLPAPYERSSKGIYADACRYKITPIIIRLIIFSIFNFIYRNAHKD